MPIIARKDRAVEFLLAHGTLPVLYWLKKDILGVPADRERRNLQKFSARVRIIGAQKSDGSWVCGKKTPPEGAGLMDQAETVKNLGCLYDYGCSPEEDDIRRAFRFLLSTQTKEGDFRCGREGEYSPIFHAMTLEQLCRYGLEGGDRRVQKGFVWILKARQQDGGWAVPARTYSSGSLLRRLKAPPSRNTVPLQPNRNKPSSHRVTGLVLRALAQSPHMRKRPETRRAGELLIRRFFCEDAYEERRSRRYWEELTYPFWTTNILSALDALSRLDFNSRYGQIPKALDWLLKRQRTEGHWESAQAKASLEDHLWVTLAVLRVLRQFRLA